MLLQDQATSDPRWAQLAARDAGADFLYSVKSTGVYCRPSCAARRANPENVLFHRTRADAERAGFRPCKRCKPDQPSSREQQAAVLERVCRHIEACESTPSLKQLAVHAGMSSFHLHRLFKAATGLTPHQYATARRMQRVRESLQQSDTVTDAIYEAGFNASSRFYAHSSSALGMTPSAFRAGGAGATIRFAVGQCSLGSILVASSEIGVCAILIGDDPSVLLGNLEDRFAGATLVGGDAGFEALVARVVGLIEQPHASVELPLDVRGTAFQQCVWKALQQIPAGSTATYTEIAERIGRPTAVRAVARACAANSLAVLIPCHRVVRNDGALSGYRWGVERKRTLLEQEREALAARTTRQH
ncbi:bifunctional DNA-binding transcriptional regulator/O6-methylguanine-DNA methyltransferase Ada [Acidipila sp. EB88]|nr:bifunctional DNA-binding transcriptional regulator/O6-methylguanine-DNA methyltransferase Ada [Acidipila sp. EB88]